MLVHARLRRLWRGSLGQKSGPNKAGLNVRFAAVVSTSAEWDEAAIGGEIHNTLQRYRHEFLRTQLLPSP
jgi:hypothetical protein